MDLLGVTCRWLGHAGIHLETDPSVVVDPFRARDPRPVDVVLVTHPHFDHLSLEDLEGFVGPSTRFVTVADAEPDLAERWPDRDVDVVAPGDRVEVHGVSIEAVPAYNLDKNYHPRDAGWVGFVMGVDGVRLYHAGDTDRIPQMEGLDVDVAFLPVSGTYVMDVDEAVEAADVLDADLAVPIHFGATVGTDRDARRFVEALGKRGVLPKEVEDG